MSKEARAAASKEYREKHNAWESQTSVADLLELQSRKQAQQAEKRRKGPAASLEKLPEPGDDYNWEKTAEKWKLSADEMTDLRRQKFCYGDSERQVFTPYLGGPVFITSDSLLAAFHALFEESFLSVEEAQAAKLPARLEQVFQKACKLQREDAFFKHAEAGKSLRQLQLVLGPAMLLLGSKPELFDEELRPELDRQVALINAAAAVVRPEWMSCSAADDTLGIDYRRFKPVGFYADKPALTQYFKAVRWLQSVPLRARYREEWEALMLLSLSSENRLKPAESGLVKNLFEEDDEPGPAVLMDILDTRYPRNAKDFNWSEEYMRKRLSRALIERHYYQVNSEQRATRKLTQVFEDLSFRVVPATALPDAVLIQRLLDKRIQPSALHLAAWLGSKAAARLLPPEELKVPGNYTQERQVLRVSRYNRQNDFGETYFHALESLNAPPEPEVPNFMKGEAWELKNLNTLASGWAQLRHTLALQAKVNANYFGLVMSPPGFVEPVPEFYSCMIKVCQQAGELMEAQGAFTTERGKASNLSNKWHKLQHITSTLVALAHKQLRKAEWSRDDEEFLKSYGVQIAPLLGYEGNSYLAPKDDAARWAEVDNDPASGTVHAIAVGRPRRIYVLYPWKGMELLCLGAVLQFYETRTRERLTDKQWQEQIASPTPPEIPAWLGARAPVLREDPEKEDRKAK